MIQRTICAIAVAAALTVPALLPQASAQVIVRPIGGGFNNRGVVVYRPGWNNRGWNNTGWNNPGWNNPGWNNPGWNNPGWNNRSVVYRRGWNGNRYVGVRF
ncbi:MAG: hypothetical protein WCL32_12030 [Planctomycetota bacterium]